MGWIAECNRHRRRRFDSIGSDVGRIAFETARIPESLPDGIFDLVVFSEIGYYWDIAGLAHVVESLVDRCEVGADFVAVHWLGHSGDHRLHGAVVHEVIAMSLAERQSFRLVSHVEPEFVLDIWRLA